MTAKSANLAQYMMRTGVLLGLFVIAGTSLLAVTNLITKERIADNEYQALLASLQELVPAASFDNDIVNDTIEAISAEWLGRAEATTVYRARQQDNPVAAVLTPVAPDGYNGKIHLLVAIAYDGDLLGVRVVNHRETPGLGDAIDVRRSDWIKEFDGKSLTNPTPDRWRVKKDGGVFDQFTGATITPRAVVKAVRKCLQYYDAHRDALFAPTASTRGDAR